MVVRPAFGTFVAVGLVSLTITFLATRGLATPLPVVLASAMAFSYVVLASGRIALRAAGEKSFANTGSWPLGVAVTGIALWVLTAALAVSAAAAFVLWAIAIAVVDVVAIPRAPKQAAPVSQDLICLALCCAFTVVWCRDLALAPVALAETGVLPVWADFFIHGGVIAQFGDPRAIGRGVLSLADFPMPFYHYASYLLPAAFAAPLDQPGLPLATSLWMPIGVLSLATAAYCLGASLAGAAGGVAGLAALFVIPDAATYGLRNGFFSFHWTLLATPTSTYALATSLLSIVLLKHWSETGASAALVASATLVGATFLYRFHIFLLLCPAWLATVAIASPAVRRNWRWFGLGGVLLFIAAILLYEHLPHLPATGSSWALDEGRALEGFLRQVHTRQSPTAYPGLYTKILLQYGEPIGFAFGILLVYPAAIGAFLLLLPLALWLERHALQFCGIDAFPIALLALYAALMMLAPTPSHHDATDLIHRPFVLLYAVTAIWTLAYAVRWLSRQGAHGTTDRLWQTMVVGFLVALPWIWSEAAEMGRPKFNWGRMFITHTVDRDLLAAAAFVRERSGSHDVVATSRVPTAGASIDLPTVLTSLTSMPAYLARMWYQTSLGGTRGKLAIDRHNTLLTIEHAPDQETAFRYLREIGVRWYVATDLSTPAWDPKHLRASLSRGRVAVYEVK